MKLLSTSPILRAGAMLLVCAALIIPTHRAAAQNTTRCFSEPGITNCISGRFLTYWNQNGGLSVFGYPITAQAPEQTPEGNFTTQYLERQRFELQPNNPAPYDVLLGRLGDQLLRRQGVDWTTLPKADPGAPNYFAQTGHSVSFGPFFQYWSANGLQDPALNAYQRSLALFGLPITEAYQTTNTSGDNVLTQWFERARFEWHPNNPPEYQVLLGLLGREWLAAPPAPQQSITITSPTANTTVGNPFTATGTTTVVPNGSVLSYGVYDSNNNLIGQGQFGVVPTSSGSQWSATIGFNPPANAGPISLAVIEPGTGGRPPVATARVNLQYGGPQQQSIRIDEPTRDQQYSRSPIRVRGATAVFPQRNVLHFVIRQAGGQKYGEGDFPVSASGSGSTFDSTVNFTPPNAATYLEVEISDRDFNGNTITQANVRVYFNPGGYPPPPSGQTITITQPAPGTLVARNFQAIGRTSQYPPNGVLNYGVTDNFGQLIGQGSIFVEPADNNSGTWAAEISFSGGNQGAPLTFEVLQPGGGPGQPPVASTRIQLQCCQ